MRILIQKNDFTYSAVVDENVPYPGIQIQVIDWDAIGNAPDQKQVIDEELEDVFYPDYVRDIDEVVEKLKKEVSNDTSTSS